jgi:hypothetical protein
MQATLLMRWKRLDSGARVRYSFDRSKGASDACIS